MSDDEPSSPFPPPVPDFGMPFYYASLTTYWVYYQVEPQLLRQYVGADYVPAVIGGTGLVVVNPQLYTSLLGTEQEGTTETEFNVVVVPRASAGLAPTTLSLDDYLAGADQTKLIGNLRLHVACDDKIAVDAGKKVFGEPKFVTTFSYTVPTPNLPGDGRWSWRCNDPVDADEFIFDLELAPLTGVPVYANPSPITGYTYLDGRAVGSRWNPLGQCLQYSVTTPGQAVITFGGSEHPMRADMQAIIGTRQAVAIQVVASPPVCVESGPYYVDR